MRPYHYLSSDFIGKGALRKAPAVVRNHSTTQGNDEQLLQNLNKFIAHCKGAQSRRAMANLCKEQ